MSFDWKSTLATVAPKLATALGGPLAGTAATTLSAALLGEARPDTQEVEAIIQQATPETLATLKAAEQAFQSDLKALDIDLERIHAGDRSDARRREVAIKDQVPALLGGAVIVGFFAAFAATLLVPFPEGSKEGLFLLLGVLGGMATAVINYYYGSSSGSDKKTVLMMRKTDG
jgi:hypothetical protein